MPNWCEGNIRVRGTYDNIVNLFGENLVTVKYDGGQSTYIPAKVIREESYTHIQMDKGEGFGWCDFYIKDTHRNFIDGTSFEIWDETDGGEMVFVLDGFRSAWSFSNPVSHEAYENMAKKYNVDIKLFGIEQGCRFMQEVAYYRDGAKEENVTEYEDWDWKCPFPRMGG